MSLNDVDSPLQSPVATLERLPACGVNDNTVFIKIYEVYLVNLYSGPNRAITVLLML